MGWKKKQPEVVKDNSHISQGGPVANDSKRIDDLENKLDKILDSMAAIEDRVKKQEASRGARAISPVPSAHSSIRRLDDSEVRLPTFEELKSDDRIQGEIQRKLHQYDNMARLDKGKSTDVFKSGRFRPGVHKVRRIVSWPQDYCTVCTGHKQPTYDDLSVLQWSQGFIQGVIEESSSTVRNTMLKHFVSCMQDAIELSFATAKRAHACVLQEMEKGIIDWQDSEKIDKIRNRNTQRILALPSQKGQVESAGAEKTMLCKLYNKGVCRYQNQTEHVDKGITYQHFCSNCLASTGKKYEHPKHQCLRLKNDKKEAANVQKV